MTTIDLIEFISTASYSTLPIYRAKKVQMTSEGEMPLSLSNLLDQKILLRESQLLLARTFSEAIANGRDVSERMEEARKGGAISEDDCLQLRHAMKLREVTCDGCGETTDKDTAHDKWYGNYGEAGLLMCPECKQSPPWR